MAASPVEFVPWRGVLVFVVLAIALGWLVCVPLWLQGGGLNSQWFPLFATAMMATPSIAALVAVFLVIRPAQPARFLGLVPVRPIRRLVIYSLLGLLVPPLLVFGVLVLGSLIGLVDVDPSFRAYGDNLAQSGTPLPPGLPIAQLGVVSLLAIPVNSIVAAVPAFGEELGWRGFLLSALRPLGTWPALLGTGVAWAFGMPR